jgi:raffinose/stachyose/melibiose transport system permease protein
VIGARARTFTVLMQIVAILFAAIVIIPFLMILINSFKGVREAALFQLSLPTEWVFSNYKTVLQQSRIVRGFTNSFIICSSVVVIDCLFGAMAAFLIQRRGRGLKHLYTLFILGLILPVSIIPTIKLMMQMGIHNTYPGIILYYTATVLPFTVFLLTGFMKSIPREMDEAALVEGSSYFWLFFRIITPLITPALITVTIVVTVNVWNDFFGPFYLISDSRKWTIILQIFSFMSQYQTNWGLVFAFMVLVVSPILIVYLILQKHILAGLTAGSVKG